MMGNTYYDELGSVQYRGRMHSQNGDSFSSPVIRRILRILLENGTLKKSNLCSKAGLNYKVCVRYVNFLARLHWVEIHRSSDQTVRISIPEEGIENLRKLEFQSDEDPQITTEDSWQSNANNSGESTNYSAAGQARRNNKSKETTESKKKNIVIIDDDESALATYSAFLETDKKFLVMTFSSSRKALEYLTLQPDSSDLILLDIRMPGMSGLRLYQAVKAINPNTKIIFLSSLDAAPELSECFSDPKLGNRNFLRKPVSRANFIETVTRASS